MDARPFSLFLLLVVSPNGSTQHNQASSEDVLEFFANGLRTCTFVKDVEREGSLFRVYGTHQSMTEFDLDDLSPQSMPSGLGTVNLLCDSPGCVRNYMNSFRNDGQWTQMQSTNSLIYSCSGGTAADKMIEAVEYYRINF